MRNIHTFLYVMLLLWGSQVATAQTQKAYEKTAATAFSKGNYSQALAYYQVLAEDFPEDTTYFYKIAESARLARSYRIAEKFFDKIARVQPTQQNWPDAKYKTAWVKKSLGKYDEAITLFSEYAATSNQTELVAISKSEIDNCEWAKKRIADSLKLNLQHFEESPNSNYFDAASLYNGKTLYFTSVAKIGSDSTQLMRMYSTDFTKEGEMLAENPAMDKLGKKENAAHWILSSDKKMAFYTLGQQTGDGQYNFAIYYRKKMSDGKWDAPVRLPDNINLAGFTATQPAIAKENDDTDILYFVSNRPQGKGGMDIWFTKITGDQFSAPVNMEGVNSNGNEISPFFEETMQTFFFSSDNRKGLGGFDIYGIKKAPEGWNSLVEHLGYPINSSYDDLYYLYHAPTGKGFFTSNRIGGLCESPEKDCICDDIYTYNTDINLLATTFLKGNGELLGCTVTLIDLTTGKIDTFATDLKGFEYNFPLNLNKDYRVIATKNGYVADSLDFSTKGIYSTTTIEKRLELRPALNLLVYIFDAQTKQPLSGVTIEFGALGASTPMNNSTIDGSVFRYSGLEMDRNYMIKGEKALYLSDKSQISTFGLKLKEGQTEIIDTLYLSPTVIALTPIEYGDKTKKTALGSVRNLALYFDNDRPNPNNKTSTTTLSYTETYNSYYNQLSVFVSKNRGQESLLRAFFNDEVKSGHDQLVNLCQLLYETLSGGDNVEVVIRGYASPLAKPEYNAKLTSRRINSVINEFRSYRGGVLARFLNTSALKIEVLPLGESVAPTTVSDDEKDLTNSWYSVEASRERKVTIIEVNKFNGGANNSLGGVNTPANTNTRITNTGFESRLVATDNNEASTTQKVKVTKKRRNKNGKLVSYTVYEDRPINQTEEVITNPVTTNVPAPVITNTVTKKATVKTAYEVVVVDANTRTVINSPVSVEVSKENGNLVLGSARKVGSGYRYSLQEGEFYDFKVKAMGYSSATVGRYGDGLATESILSDTVYLTPFSGLPLPLYFDNDKPNSNSRATTTSTTYNQAYSEFVAKKTLFVSQYNKSFAQTEGNGEMNTFFENEVKGGYEQFNGFLQIAKFYLQRGAEIEFVLEGYASPLSDSEYNKSLTARRVASVNNQIATFGAGILKKYMDTGKLKISVESLGENSAPTSVSDDANNLGKSVYSVGASKERKVLIKDIRLYNY